ncbi:hypothetical protein GCM10010399_34290 [Dactylosporangium fulvum]|uniref:Uncharacterized protein n=1 Tax=Dactylosporangium fulvum TaxID=53359 RepID=A0ABY5W1D1_9ACTN|nr:hypothetical protein [Dactylosporangium fulvum]UWP83166.1 hypothetical protein Dfulv_02330 [Dactylosporangium fulvum]
MELVLKVAVAWQDRLGRVLMGSSAWSYTVDYQTDVNAALQQLRRQVYDRGDYYRESRDLETHSIIDMVNGVSAQPAFATVSPLPPTT